MFKGHMFTTGTRLISLFEIWIYTLLDSNERWYWIRIYTLLDSHLINYYYFVVVILLICLVQYVNVVLQY
jgi:hypothetical protein